jgi:putative ABC transport system permease protein
MSGFTQDIRYAWRGLRKSPGFFLIAVLTLALGIGANSAIFSIVNAVLIRPLPYDHSDQLVLLLESNPRRGLPVTGVSPANFVDWQRQSTSFSSMSAIQSTSFNYRGDSGAIRIDGASISPNTLDMLRVKPIMGRTFQRQEGESGRDGVVLIGETLWHRQFGSDPQILNKLLTMNGRQFTVIGVLPAWFEFPFQGVEIWKPLAFTNADITLGLSLLLRDHLRSGSLPEWRD